MMMETSDIFAVPQVDPGEPGSLDFLKHALFDYKEERKGDTLYIEGQIGLQETVADVGQMLFDAFEANEHVTFLDGGEGRLSLLFDEPRPDGVKVIEVRLRKSD